MPKVFVGIGSNIDRDASIRAGVQALRKHYREVQLSSVYESAAVGFDGDPFYNLVAAFDTEESVDQVVAVLAKIEDDNGRVRGDKRFSARTLDLDLLLYGDLIAEAERFHVPRDEIPRYAFVLWPLAEIAPALKHPQSGQTYADMWEMFDKTTQSLRPVPFSW